jgi:hypothetical protein
MKLLTKTVAKTIPALYSTEHFPEDQKKCVVKFFNPTGAGTWYVFEGSASIVTVSAEGTKEAEKPLSEVDLKDVADVRFFGYVTGLACNEWGYFTLNELASYDLHYTPETAEQIVAREG